MTSPTPPPPPPEPQPARDPAQRRKAVAIGINVLLFVGIVAAVILNGRGGEETPVEAGTATVATTEPGDESDAFVTGIQRAEGSTTTTPEQEGGIEPPEPSTTTSTAPSTTTASSTTTTEPPAPPELTGEIDEFGIPVGLEFPLYHSEHTIIGGENLWLIAANQLAALTDRDVTEVPEPEVVRYWERVIEINRANLRSGDPNLVYPGEVVKFPEA